MLFNFAQIKVCAGRAEARRLIWRFLGGWYYAPHGVEFKLGRHVTFGSIQMKVTFTMCLLIPTTLFLASCIGNDEQTPTAPPPPDAMKSEPTYCQNLSSTLVIRDRMQQEVSQFSAGETIFLESTITNNSNSPVILSPSDLCPQVSFAVYRTAGTPDSVWASSDDRVCGQMIMPVTFPPGEAWTFSAEWNQTLRDNTQAPAGRYKVRTKDSTECRARIEKESSLILQ